MKKALSLALEALEIVDDSCPKDINEGETAVLVALSVAEVEAIRSVIGLVRLVVQPDPLADTGKVIERIDIDSRTIEVWPARVGQEPEPSSECNPQDLCAGCRCKYGAQPPLPVQPEQEPVAHSVIAGALFDFMGWLTSRKERIVLSSADNASPAVDAIRDFANMRGLSLDDAKVLDWNTTPPQRPWVGLTDDQREACTQSPFTEDNYQDIEDKLKELNT